MPLRKSAASAGNRKAADRDAGDDGQAASRLPSMRRLAGDQRVGAVGGDEVDDRRFVLEVPGEIDPALIGLEQDVLVGRLVELPRAPR